MGIIKTICKVTANLIAEEGTYFTTFHNLDINCLNILNHKNNNDLKRTAEQTNVVCRTFYI